MGYSSGVRFSKAKPTGSFRVLQPRSRAVASHEETLQEARKSAAYWVRASSGSMEIQERFPSGKWVTVETITRESLKPSKKRAHATKAPSADDEVEGFAAAMQWIDQHKRELRSKDKRVRERAQQRERKIQLLDREITEALRRRP